MLKCQASDCATLLPPETKFCFECGYKQESQEILKCPKCAAPFHKGAKFCSNCQFNVGQAHTEIKRCSSCNHVLQPGQRFCSECATPATAWTTPATASTVQSAAVPSVVVECLGTMSGSELHSNVSNTDSKDTNGNHSSVDQCEKGQICTIALDNNSHREDGSAGQNEHSDEKGQTSASADSSNSETEEQHGKPAMQAPGERSNPELMDQGSTSEQGDDNSKEEGRDSMPAMAASIQCSEDAKRLYRDVMTAEMGNVTVYTGGGDAAISDSSDNMRPSFFSEYAGISFEKEAQFLDNSQATQASKYENINENSSQQKFKTEKAVLDVQNRNDSNTFGKLPMEAPEQHTTKTKLMATDTTMLVQQDVDTTKAPKADGDMDKTLGGSGDGKQGIETGAKNTELKIAHSEDKNKSQKLNEKQRPEESQKPIERQRNSEEKPEKSEKPIESQKTSEENKHSHSQKAIEDQRPGEHTKSSDRVFGSVETAGAWSEKKRTFAEVTARPPVSTSGHSKNTQQSSTVNNKNAILSSTDKVAVTFHVIVSDLWNKMDSKKYDIFIRCNPSSLGGFDGELRNKMEFKGLTGFGFLYEGTVQMDKHLRNTGFYYKFVARKAKKAGKGDIIWEIVQRRSPGRDQHQHQHLVNRYFSIPESKKQHTGVWHRYDGVAYFPEVFISESLLTKLKKMLGFEHFGDKFRQDVLESAKVFFPTDEEIYLAGKKCATDGQPTLENYIQKIEHILSSLKFQMLDRNLQNVDDELCLAAIFQCTVNPILKRMSENRFGNAALGIFLLILKKEFKLPFSDFAVVLLCQGLLVGCDMSNSSCADMDLIFSHFQLCLANRRALISVIVKLIDDSAIGGKNWADPSWLYSVPLVHFLQEKSKPFTDLKPDSDFKSSDWWGLVDLNRRKDHFKEATRYKMLTEAVPIDVLTPVFKLDALFVRTLVASLHVKPLLPLLLSGYVPLEVMAAALAHHLNTNNFFLDEEMQKIGSCMDLMINILEKNEKRNQECDNYKQIACTVKIIGDLHKELLMSSNSRLVSVETILKGTLLMYMAFDCLAQLEEKSNGASTKNWKHDVRLVSEATCTWLSKDFGYKSDRQQSMKNWDMLMTMLEERLANADLKSVVQELFTKNFEKELRKLQADHRLAVYLEQYKVAPAFADILNRLAFESLSAAFEMDAKQLTDENVSLVSLLSAFIEGKWSEQVKDEKDVLTFVIGWIPMVNYFKRLGKASRTKSSFSVRATEYIQIALDCIQQQLNDLNSGSITIATLQLLMDNADRFLTLVEAARNDKGTVTNLLRLRKHELKAYMKTATQLDYLFENCKPLLQTGDLEKILDEASNIRNSYNFPLSVVSEVALPDSFADLKSYRPVCNPWKLPIEVLAVLPEFSTRITSFIFRRMFSEGAKRQGDLRRASFWRSFQHLWKEIDSEWQTLCAKMADGSIPLSEAEKIFSPFYTGSVYRYDELSKELNKLDNSGSWVQKRIDQFVCFNNIKKYVKAAKMLLIVKNKYNINGDFNDIDKICSLSQDKDLPLGDVDSSVLKLCDVLEGISPHDNDTMKTFTSPRCVEFVSWLRENMKDGVKELHVFVDLAFISAGEEPWAIDRVSCFHASAIGFAPLIFIEQNVDSSQLLQQCRLVFSNIKSDPNLPKKLLDTSRYLDWFKDVQKSHGSVEKTSLSQVTNISSRGVFRLGREKNQQDFNLSGVIHLKVTEEKSGKSEESSPPRKYSYDELLDLQSRLMLVAGQAEKGKENVDHFLNIMEHLVRLGKTYIQLCHDGCVLFLDWTVAFLCDATKPVCCVSEFATKGKLKGHRYLPEASDSRKEDVEHFIAGVASFLEHCHSEWLDYVDLKRKEYPELNVYTVEQLVFLQQQLVKVGTEDIDLKLYPMLSLLKTNCTPQHLQSSLTEAMDRIDALQRPAQPTGSCAEAAPADNADKDKEAAFVAYMIEGGFTRALALKAVDAVGVEDMEDGLLWCMDHAEEEMEASGATDGPETGDLAQDEGPSGERVGQRLRTWVGRKETITKCAIDWLDNMEIKNKGTSLRSLVDNLTSVWRKFLDTVSSSGTDFLSLEHLGIVLSCLAEKDERKFQRALPPSFRAKEPNLILCPKREVLNVLTYLYMFPEEEGSPLPQPDEVLLCTQCTTFEQVDILLRRAFFGRQEKVYTLAFADNLDYDVGEKVEKKIQQYSTMAEKDFKFVVVCTTENEFRTRIVAALEKFRHPNPSLSSSKLVRKYLHSRLVTRLTKDGRQSASCLDPESLSVRVVQSNRSGVGKTLYKERVKAKLQKSMTRERRPVSITIPLHSREADVEHIAKCLLLHTLPPASVLPRIIHLDISYQVLEGVDHLLYNLLVLGCITDHHGQVWLRSPMDLYLVETMPLYDHRDNQREHLLVHQILDILPSLNCWSPFDSFRIMRNPAEIPGYQTHDCLFDDEEFRSDLYQRPFRYLRDYERQGQQPQAQGDAVAEKRLCLETLLKYCGVHNPSWSELTHFVCFLNKQLQDFETSLYCSMATSQDLPGFSVFVLRFLIQMSRDFATRSLKMSEESLAALHSSDEEEGGIQQYEMRRTWESSPHPYIFFNPDGHSMTFLGFTIEQATGNLVDQQTRQVLEAAIMTKQLYQALKLNRVPLTDDFDVLPREDRLLRLYRVLGLHDEEVFGENGEIIDPDDTYELTTDNVKKILAIYMRFRCNIPVIVMGETGCGKTRLVKFLCALQTPRNPAMNTMVLVKVHGGTTGEDIISKVRKAEKLAQDNAKAFQHRPVYTVLFFDEANTTEAVGVIKEVMCDGTLDGQLMNLDCSLKMVAACNPYRKHTDDLIERLENAGLGYHVDADKTVDKLGRVPMRRLVYRVQPLPQSMLPLVWDFGQLNTAVEAMYIRQMVRRYVRNGKLKALSEAGIEVMCKILMESQEFMRRLADECSFVSLRDVDRALTVTSWLFGQAQGKLFDLLDRKLGSMQQMEDEEEDVTDSEEEEEAAVNVSVMTKALVLSLGVCYRACLRSKREYDTHIVQFFKPPFNLPGGAGTFSHIIDRCQEVFLDNVRLEDNIARNQALKENVFMMVVCVELRIPLFLVGKPGSSKSLAKMIVAESMQGNAGHELFTTLKQAHMVSFQCSPLATADGILGTFRQCAEIQKGKNLDKFVSVVVLDEVGLAEDSPKMPLKTLHPLLEDGCPGDEIPEESKKVAFIGISNWALDPAKMNRGILVQRDVPDIQELTDTANGICTTRDKLALEHVKILIPDMAKAYLSIFKQAKKKREFFGLRDFYSLVKMVYAFAARSKAKPSHRQLTAAIRRNFGGLDSIDPVESFSKLLPARLRDEPAQDSDPDCSTQGLIQAALKGDDMGGESRYLLLLTENYGGLSILSENLLAGRQAVPIFGSSFPRDQEYTQICRNINRIKVCMETGQTVILLNLENLYESLYDALNQYYAMLGGERYVDLGLGTHRVKCRVHRQFRLIVVAEKQVVYDKFPIPLINRLEKHFLTLNNIMTEEQLSMARRLEEWAKEFASSPQPGPMTRSRAKAQKAEESIGDVFIGYHADAAPAVVLRVWTSLDVDHMQPPDDKDDTIFKECQRLLLWCATPDKVVRCQEREQWGRVYHEEQQHEHLLQYLQHQLQHHQHAGTMLMAQITTHSKLLTEQERLDLQKQLAVSSVKLLSLQAFDTEQQFCQQLREFFMPAAEGHKLLIVQCDSRDSNQNLVKGAQYCMQDNRPKDCTRHHVVFLVQLDVSSNFTGFLGGSWHCLYIDELRGADHPVPPITALQSHTPGQLLMAHFQLQRLQAEVPPEEVNLMQWDDDTENAGVGQQEETGLQTDEVAQVLEDQQQMEVDVEDVELEVTPGKPSHIFEETSADSSQSRTEAQPASAMAMEFGRPQLEGFDPLYVQRLFINCVQAAVAKVKDTVERTEHATKRISLLLTLLDENGQFFHGLHKLVGSVLMEREEKMYEAEQWLSKEAARQEAVKKAGTFRSAWMQYLENKTVPVLAGVVAYLDTNHNLLLMQSPHAWLRELWLGVLRDVCQLTYRNMQSLSGKEEMEEFPVHHTGAGSAPFSAALPFSWLLWQLVQKTITETRLSGRGENLLDTAGNFVDQSPLGKCVMKHIGDSPEILQHLFDLYLSDFVCFTFPVQEPLEQQLLCQCVTKGLRQLKTILVDHQLGRGLVYLHLLVEVMQPRLQAILDLASCRPQAIEVLNLATGPSTDILRIEDEVTEDIALLLLLMEELQPRPAELVQENERKEWIARYSSIAPVILRVLHESDAIISAVTRTDSQQEDNGDDEQTEMHCLPYGQTCRCHLVNIKCLWTRATTLKLFFDSLGPLRHGPAKLRQAMDAINLKLFNKLLERDVNMKIKKSLEHLDKFLKHANGTVLKGLIGKVGKCAYCEQSFESAPVMMPCKDKHQLCNSCYRESVHGTKHPKCPQCEQAVPRNFEPTPGDTYDRESLELLGRYQRQVSGFLMAVVSQLCFDGRSPPEPDSIKHIFGYITHISKGKTLLQTKHMTVHDDLIDPTPVLRSFLLRLLLKHSERDIHAYLDEFLKKAQRMVEQEAGASVKTSNPESMLVEFSLLTIHCIEDLHHERHVLIAPDISEEDHLAAKLREQLPSFDTTFSSGLTSLYFLGVLRYTLDACAHLLHKIFVSSAVVGLRKITPGMEDLLELLEIVCEKSKWAKKFLVRQLCREYGIQDFLSLCKMAERDQRLTWIIVRESAGKVEEVADRYLVCGKHYKAIRDGVFQLRLQADPGCLHQLLQSLREEECHKETLLLLSLHRVITMSILNPLPPPAHAAMMETVSKFVQECDVLQDKALAQAVCNNQLEAAPHIQPNQDLSAQNMVCLLSHLRLALRPSKTMPHLLNPLYCISFLPSRMQTAFLPTMPQDNLEEIVAVIKEKVWQCPNGHRYLIGDCGKPNMEGYCPCGRKIGGLSHNPVAQNAEYGGGDMTQRGHILGPAAQRGIEAVPERQLSAAECALIRFLTHACLYLAALQPSLVDAVSQMIVPRQAAADTERYFWDHVQHDVRVLQRVLGRSSDDVYLVLHHICHLISEKSPGGQTASALQTKQERDVWEKHFAAVYIAPTIKDLEKIVGSGNRAIMSDTQQGESVLLKLVYEEDTYAAAPETHDLLQLPSNPCVWRHRPRITVNHFFRQFHLQVETQKAQQKAFPVIRLLKSNLHILHALYYIPAILAGQRRLMMQLHRRLDRAEAETLSINQVKEGYERTGLEQLLKNFSCAWELVKEHLIQFRCYDPVEGFLGLPEEYHNYSLTGDSPVALLLSSTRGAGLCSYLLLQYLLRHNNDFLRTYCPMVKLSYDKLPEVAVRALTERHLVGCHPDRELLPLVLSYSNYSLMVGQAATLEYDFAAFEQQLCDVLLQCKARVQVSQQQIELETMVYRADTTSSRVFRILREKIPQECLSPAERRQIVEELRDNLPDICQSIDRLNTALSFLRALGGKPDTSLDKFMSGALKMKTTVHSRKAQQTCQLKHVQSLWIVLCYRKTAISALNRLDAFDSVGKELREPLSQEQQTALTEMCNHMSVDRLELLLLQMFECIMLRLSEPRLEDDDSGTENVLLKEMINGYLDSPPYETEPVELRSGLIKATDLDTFPSDLQCRHSTATWLLCHQHLVNKRQQLL